MVFLAIYLVYSFLGHYFCNLSVERETIFLIKWNFSLPFISWRQSHGFLGTLIQDTPDVQLKRVFLLSPFPQFFPCSIKVIIYLFSIYDAYSGQLSGVVSMKGRMSGWEGDGQGVHCQFSSPYIFLTVLRGRSLLIEFGLAEVVLVPVKVNSWELLWRGGYCYSWAGDEHLGINPFHQHSYLQGGCLSTPFISSLCTAEPRV